MDEGEEEMTVKEDWADDELRKKGIGERSWERDCESRGEREREQDKKDERERESKIRSKKDKKDEQDKKH